MARYAREIAQLKTKLAEKDAQLLGGFGSLANLYLSELPVNPGGLNPVLNPAAAAAIQQPGLGVLPGVFGSAFGGSGFVNPAWGMQAGFGAVNGGALGRTGPGDNGSRGAGGAAAAGFCGAADPPAAAAAGLRSPSAAAGRSGSPKLQPIANTSTTAATGSPPRSQQQGYQMRAGTAEGALGAAKPGSPLAPIAAPRLSTSAEGIRSGRFSSGDGAGNAGAVAATPGSPQHQQLRLTRDLNSKLDFGGSSLRGPAAAGAAIAAAQSPGRSPVAAERAAERLQHPAILRQQQQSPVRSPLLTADGEGTFHA